MFSKIIRTEKTLLESLHELYNLWDVLETCKEGEALFPCARLYQDGFRSFEAQWYRRQLISRESAVSRPEVKKILVRALMLTEYMH